MSSIVVSPHAEDSSPARHQVAFGNGGKLFALIVLVVGGSALFVMSRELVWGREEPISGLLRWTLAAMPYVLYLAAAALSTRSSERAFELWKRTDFLPIWTLSMSLFVIMRGSTAAAVYEDPIYRMTEPGLLRYAILSGLYVGAAAMLVSLWRVLRRSQSATGAEIVALFGASTLFAWALFCSLIFVVAI